MIDVSLAYATPQSQDLLRVQVEQGTTIYQALEQSGWLVKYKELATWYEQIKRSDDSFATKPNARQWCVGVYSQKKPLNYILQENDRIEIYRSLHFDPMKRRKARAKW